MLRYAADRHTFQNREEPLDEVLVEIARSMGVDYLAAGTVGRFDDTLVIVLKLIDIDRAKVMNRVVESCRGPIGHLPLAMRFATARLFGREISGRGDLSIVTDARGQLRIDQNDPAPLPEGGAPLVGIEAAKHQLSINAEGYFPYNIDFYIDPTAKDPLRLRPELEELPLVWYESPLLWTAVGVVVAGTTTALLLLTLPPQGAPLAGDL